MGPLDEHSLFETWWKTSVVGVAVVAQDGTWVDCNPALSSFLGYTIAELRKKRFQDITHPEDVAADESMARDLAAGLITSYDMAKRYITKPGVVVWANLRVCAIRDRDNNFVVFFSQVAPLLPVERLGQSHTNERKVSFLWVKEKWPVIAIIVGSLAYFCAETIKYLLEK